MSVAVSNMAMLDRGEARSSVYCFVITRTFIWELIISNICVNDCKKQ